MADLTRQQVELLHLASKILCQERRDPGKLPVDPEFDNFEDLRRFVGAVRFENFIDDTLKLTREALIEVSQKLADAHEAAAAISVEAPTKKQVESFKEKLEALQEDIQADRRFHKGLKLAQSLVKTMKNRLQS